MGSNHLHTNPKHLWRELLTLPVIVSALGYFVDIYDLILFSIVRVQSLKSIGLTGQELLDTGVFLLNMQMGGMLIGGIIWGILGDKRGRVKILFGSIFLYSVANIANGMVGSVTAYALCRFIAGIGLAGELGAGVTLVLEHLPSKIRGYGTMLIASIGVMGAVLAYYIAEHFDWRNAYYFGGAMGMALLFMRLGVLESGMYKRLEATTISRGNFLSLFTNRGLFYRYVRSTLIGMPIWYCVGILITFSPEFAKALNVSGAISAGQAVMYCYIGLIFGDFSSGTLSQIIKSRKKAVFAYIILTTLSIAWYFSLQDASTQRFYFACGLIGFAVGYWAVFITIAAEQFGTNLRATVATTVPNFIRGTVIPITLLFQFASGYLGIINGAIFVGALCILIALLAAAQLEETFSKDLDYLETARK